MSDEDKSPKNIFEVIQNIAFKILDRPGGIFYLIVFLGVAVIGIIFWKVSIDPRYSPFAIVTIIFLILLAVIFYLVFIYRPSSSEPPLNGRYFIGIDIGRDKIKYCLIDYKRFEEGNYKEVRILHGTRRTPRRLNDVYNILGEVIVELSNGAQKKGIRPIDGIGLGLPGQVDPREGTLLKSPGFDDVSKPFVLTLANHIRNNLKDHLQNQHPEILNKDFPIEIDNDVRCATRYVWKREGFNDAICIFVGNGLGSGIILGGRMIYGHKFTAGEIGHTTISEGKGCKCGLEGGHWEMYVSSYGIINIAKTLNPEEYERLKENYERIIQQERYQELLRNEKFKNHPKEPKEYLDEKGELTSYFFSLAFYAGEKYACKVVEEFIKYLGIGIANYLNVINPRRVYLGGGMIEAFYTDDAPINTVRLLNETLRKYALPSATEGIIIQKGVYEETRFADIGAALIFKDHSYFEYKRRQV